MDREKTIANMCFTFRHDYGLEKPDPEHNESEGIYDLSNILSAGMYKHERELLWRQMAQIFDNDIAPYMEFKNKMTSKNICGND
jgi:hypothetical protein